MKRRATGLLLLAAVGFVVVSALGHGRGWSAPVQALFEGSMVGALADWFAVTALFRHPLGLPIPHTAIVRARKNQFGQTLATFIVDNFLSAEVVVERLRASHAVDRAAGWVAEPANASAVGRQAAVVLAGVLGAAGDEEFHRLLQRRAEQALQGVAIVPLATRAVGALTAHNLHQDLLDAGLRSLGRFLDQHHAQLRERFGRGTPWWMPDKVESRLFERLLDGVRDLVRDVNADPGHELRVQFDAWVRSAPERLEQSADLLARIEQVRADLAGYPELRAWTVSAWADLIQAVRSQAEDEGSDLRRQLAAMVTRASRRLVEDPDARAGADRLIESALRAVLANFHEELAALVTGTIARWDADETSDKLELLLGPDLQFIRINGTVVGGLAGVVIYTVGRAIGGH